MNQRPPFINFRSLYLCLWMIFITISPPSYASNDSTKVRKSWQNKIEIGTMAGSFFDGEGHHFTEYRSSETLSPLNFSITYQIRIKNDQIFKLRWFSYSRTINPLPENYVPPRGSESGPGYRNIDVGSFSYGKQHSWDFNPLHCLRSYYTFDFSYKLGTDALSSGMGSTNAHFSNPGIGMSFGSDIVLFARYTIGTELSYSHHFFQTGWQGNWHSGRPSADMFMQHFKIGYIFWSNRKW